MAYGDQTFPTFLCRDLVRKEQRQIESISDVFMSECAFINKDFKWRKLEGE